MTARGNRAFAEQLMEQQGAKCFYCHNTMTWRRNNRNRVTLDHKTPIVRGGHDVEENLVACCARCNFMKGALTAEEYARAIEWSPSALEMLQEMHEADVANLRKVVGQWKELARHQKDRKNEYKRCVRALEQENTMLRGQLLTVKRDAG